MANLTIDFKKFWTPAIIYRAVNFCPHGCKSKQAIVLAYLLNKLLAAGWAFIIKQGCQEWRWFFKGFNKDLASLTTVVVDHSSLGNSRLRPNPLTPPKASLAAAASVVGTSIVGSFWIKSCTRTAFNKNGRHWEKRKYHHRQQQTDVPLSMSTSSGEKPTQSGCRGDAGASFVQTTRRKY